MAEKLLFRTSNNVATIVKQGATNPSVGVCWGQSIVWARRQIDKGAELERADSYRIMSDGAGLQFLYQFTETRGALTFGRWAAALKKYEFGLYKYEWSPGSYTVGGALQWIKGNLKDKYVQINCDLGFGRHAMGLYFADAASYFFDANVGLRRYDTGADCLNRVQQHLTADGFNVNGWLVALDLRA